MRVRIAPGRRKPPRESLGILPVLEDDMSSGLPGDPVLGGSVLELARRAAGAESFQGNQAQVMTVHLPAGSPMGCLMVVGLGKLQDFSSETLRSAVGEAARRVPKGFRNREAASLILDPTRPHWAPREAPAGTNGEAGKEPGPGEGGSGGSLPGLLQALAEGWALGSYAYGAYQTEKKPEPVPELEVQFVQPPSAERKDLEAALGRAEVIAEAVILARNLANAPANEVHPVSLARRAREEARARGFSCQILDEKAIRKEKMGALLGVAQGSDIPPRFLVTQYRPPGKEARRPLVYVGKAITFDSGGLSLKPSKGMEEMKADMSGGAAVLAALGALARLKPPTPVVGLIPCAENMVSGRSIKPGDIVRSRAGLTIEVINTDAEGRLILADALDYARRFRPRLVVDVATLTGACVVALGDVVTGLIASDPKASDALRKASEASGEPVWQLPLYREYFDALKSDVADLKNSGGRNAGAITAGAFLSRFIEGIPWAHLDIAGTAWSEKETGYRNKGATGVGVRLLVELAFQEA